MRRPALALAGIAVLLSSCAPLPETGPHLATDSRPGDAAPAGGGPAPGPESEEPVEWATPEADAQWEFCPPDLGVDRELPGGVTAECSALPSSIGEALPLPLRIPLVRVTTNDTPSDAPPLVVVAGPDAPIGPLMSDLARRAPALADAHPLVGVAHRGAGDTTSECLSRTGRHTFSELADTDVDPFAGEQRAEISAATNDCLDALLGAELEFGAEGAARDLEVLRDRWAVPGLGILSIGSGSRTATAYAATNPDGVSLLALDSPAPLGGDEEDAARAALEGSEAALRGWAAACTRPDCGPGDAQERVDALEAAISDAAGGDGPIRAAALSDVIRAALADVAGASEESVSSGDRILAGIVEGGAERPGRGAEALARGLSATSLPFVAGCTDLTNRVPLSSVADLETEFAEASPVFGRVLARQMHVCSAWPTTEPQALELPGRLPGLVLASTADPVGGALPAETAAATLTAAGMTTVGKVQWRGPGSRALLHSECAREALTAFLAEPGAEHRAECPS